MTLSGAAARTGKMRKKKIRTIKYVEKCMSDQKYYRHNKSESDS